MQTIYTIGFTKRTAKEFFTILERKRIRRVVDIRLNNRSQLAGFTKKNDLIFFLERISGIGYMHLAQLAPSEDILDDYKKKRIDWSAYEKRYLRLLGARRADELMITVLKDGDCLLCSEREPDHCHRRLAAEYLAGLKKGVEIVHL